MAADDEHPAEPPADAPTRRRVRRGVVIALGGLLVVVLGAAAWWVLGSQPEIAYDGPDGVAAPGAEVTIRDPDGTCGPLVVSLHRQAFLGLWSQTHSGNISSGFTPAARPWWKARGGTYMTPVPCAMGGEITFTLPEDIEPGTIAACDMDRRCAEIRVG